MALSFAADTFDNQNNIQRSQELLLALFCDLPLNHNRPTRLANVSKGWQIGGSDFQRRQHIVSPSRRGHRTNCSDDIAKRNRRCIGN